MRLVAALSLVSVFALTGPVTGQADINTAELSRISPVGAYNDIWGYTAPDGREYALLGAVNGFSVINVTDPVKPYQTGWFPGGTCTWRDLKTFGHYMYVVTDCQSGVVVVDLDDPENPVQVNTFGLGTIQHAHNVAIDTDTGILYAVGTQSGMYVYDLNVNPVNPPLIDQWGTNSYIHDISIQDGLAHAAMIYAGDLRVLNVSNPSNVNTISITDTETEFAHSTWPNADNSVVVVADETLGDRHLAFFDMSNPNNPQLLGKYSENPISVPHNPFIKGDICYVSWYTEGFIALDISDPASPSKIGRFDTQPNTEPGGQNGFKGAWGCYPFAESGFIYISDRSRGLFVLNLADCAIGLPFQGDPQICRVWPDTVSALKSPRQRVVLTGKGFTNTTAINVGGTVIGPDDFKIVTDQVLHFRMPLVSSAGFNDIVVTRPQGVSLPSQIEVVLPEGPMLDTGEVEQEVGADMLVAFGTDEPGHLMFPVISFTQSPSVVPNKVAFDIGAAFSDLFFLPTFTSNGAGVGGFPVNVPAAGLGATVYWQVAIVDPSQGLPADVTSVSSTLIVEAGD